MTKTEFTKDDLKLKFVERYKQICPDFDAFVEFSFKFLRRSLRVNTLKITVPELKERMEKAGWILTKIPWCDYGFFIDHETGRRDIGNTIEHALGYIYVQEAVSMIPPIVLNPKPGDKVLDMCASPGSKTTQMGQLMENKGILVANDIKGDRLASLGINVQRIGLTNCVITQMTGQRFRDQEFDKVLVDAPCSATGAIRKSFKTIKIWNPNMIKRLAITQKQLIKTGFMLLKKGGEMVYSTCSVEPEEDEGVVDYLVKEFNNVEIEKIELPIKRGAPIKEFDGSVYSSEVEKCLRLWPQDNDTEGFFITKIKKLPE